MTLIADIENFQKEINLCLDTTDYLHRLCDQIQEDSSDELTSFLQKLIETCEELDQQLSLIGNNLLCINYTWGNTPIKHYDQSNISGTIKLVEALNKITSADGENKILKSPRLVDGKSQKLKENLIAKGIPYTNGYQAHHIIPSNVADKSDLMLNVIEKAGFDIDCAENGFFLPANFIEGEPLPSHRGSHPRYSNYAEDVLKHEWDKLRESGLQDDKIALLNAIHDVINHLKDVIKTQGKQMQFTVNDL
jgi:A nuclease family of the HNH/ENDO VII superfamily with conserved AHH